MLSESVRSLVRSLVYFLCLSVSLSVFLSFSVYFSLFFVMPRKNVRRGAGAVAAAVGLMVVVSLSLCSGGNSETHNKTNEIGVHHDSLTTTTKPKADSSSAASLDKFRENTPTRFANLNNQIDTICEGHECNFSKYFSMDDLTNEGNNFTDDDRKDKDQGDRAPKEALISSDGGAETSEEPLRSSEIVQDDHQHYKLSPGSSQT